jgi:hypothetical protein
LMALPPPTRLPASAPLDPAPLLHSPQALVSASQLAAVCPLDWVALQPVLVVLLLPVALGSLLLASPVPRLQALLLDVEVLLVVPVSFSSFQIDTKPC